MVYSEGLSKDGYTGGLRLISDGRLFLGRLCFAFLAPLLLACFAFKEVLCM
jgi:hypothetical protein